MTAACLLHACVWDALHVHSTTRPAAHDPQWDLLPIAVAMHAVTTRSDGF